MYIIGKYTGLCHEVAVKKFAETEQMLIDAGINHKMIVSPMNLGIHKDTPWDEAMKTCVENLRKCNAVFIQKDWKTSFGARKEITIADQIGHTLFWEANNDIKKIKAFAEANAF